jgi:murein DD-endopeptidase MepM/ murein hydrolase activator NlpD
MTQATSFKGYRHPLLHVLWLGGLCWLSSIGAEAPVLAQAVTDVVVPSAEELLLTDPPAAEAPPPIESFEAAPPEPAPEPVAEPIPVEPAPSKSVDLELTSPTTEALPENPASETDPPLVNPNLSQQAEAAFGQSGDFIDPTPYSLGATDNPSVVLSERSTGCEAVVQPGGGVPSSVCSYSLGETAYQGGSINSTNFGDMSLSVVYGGRTTPSGRDYYNLTIRPPARLSSANLSFLFPLSIPAAITSAFGWRIHPVVGESRFHSGTDLGAPHGTPVLAAFSGKVAVADFMGGYGLAVVLQHQNGSEETLYGHLSEIFVKPGETVKQGEVIGRVGSTGLSTGPHLHFEFRKQTANGWVVMDAGGAIENALSQFVNALKLGLAYPPQLAAIRSASFTKALEMAQAKPEAKSETNKVTTEAEPEAKTETKLQAQSQD